MVVGAVLGVELVKVEDVLKVADDEGHLVAVDVGQEGQHAHQPRVDGRAGLEINIIYINIYIIKDERAKLARLW